MLSFSKVNKNLSVTYQATNFASSQAITLVVLKPDQTTFPGSPFVMTEINLTGLYTFSFIPVDVGTHTLIIYENGNKSSVMTVEIMNYDIDEIGVIVSGISGSGSSTGGYIP
jgi:hypothetical protein